ncbi:transmembrane secretion effector [Mumia flava]|uniref:Transmembrane secretion effector n=1 Tax=Mumia flava TaxID=1348852 RepID=A0A2M9B6C0_9ACTN|nr:MFS transporter [Mumia flava]PJJ53506.1 transmembrane secretion effector [Mumia flava]
MSERVAARAGAPPGQHRLPMVGLLVAMAVAHTGTRVSAVALPWFVLSTTGSPTKTGLVALFELTPYVLVKALGGPVIDRIGGRRVSWTTDLVSALAAAAIPVLHVAGGLSFGLFLGLVAVVGAARGPGDLAKEVMVPESADRAHVPLERATGLSGTVERLASTVGPAVGGAFIGLFGPLAGLGVTAGMFVLGSAVVALALPKGMGGPQRGDAEAADLARAEAGYLRQLAEGFAFLRSDRLILVVAALITVTNLLDVGWTSVILPVWASDTGGGAAAVGAALTTMGAAAVVGSILAATFAHRMPRREVFLVGFLVAGAPRIVVLAFDVPFGVVLAVMALAGFGAGFVNPILSAVLFERVPRRLYGRVGALVDALAWAGMPVGGLAAGLAISGVGFVPTVLVAGGVYAVATLLAGLRPEWREMDRARAKARANGPTSSARA